VRSNTCVNARVNVRVNALRGQNVCIVNIFWVGMMRENADAFVIKNVKLVATARQQGIFVILECRVAVSGKPSAASRPGVVD